jgi:hypothetical protein
MMNMNSKQRLVLIIGILVILSSFVIWQLTGGEFFTQTEIIVDKQDEFFKKTTKELEEKFVWGLDLTLIVSGITLVISGYVYNKLTKS